MVSPPSRRLGYEVNPPKIFNPSIARHNELEEGIRFVFDRLNKLQGLSDLIELTDSVLGVPRLSSVTTGGRIKRAYGDAFAVRCNIRVCDHNLNSIIQQVGEATLMSVEGMLFLKGDKPKYGEPHNSSSPSKVVAALRELGFDGLKLYLSTPVPPSEEALEKKVKAEPDGLVTHPIQSLDALYKTVDLTKGFGIDLISSVLVPSKRNKRSAELLGHNWASYEGDVEGFAKEVRKVSSEVLISSPNHFDAGVDLLKALKGVES